MRKFAPSFAAALLIGIAWPAAGCRGQQAAASALEEIIVTGERAGPNMWRVQHGGATVWILGSLAPLPRGITWRSKRVEAVLRTSSQVLLQKPFEVSVPRILWALLTDRKTLLVTGGKRLADRMPPDQYRRFAALRKKYVDDDKEWEHYRPIVAAAFLQQAAFHQIGLSMRLDLGASVRMLAKNAHVRVVEVNMADTGDMLDALKSMPAATEDTCVEGSLVTIETALPRLVERARAWVDGNIERLQELPIPPEVDACRAALDAGKGASSLITRLRQSWLYAIEKLLQGSGTSIAVVNLDLLLEPGGLLDQLRAAGYQIDNP